MAAMLVRVRECVYEEEKMSGLGRQRQTFLLKSQGCEDECNQSLADTCNCDLVYAFVRLSRLTIDTYSNVL